HRGRVHRRRVEPADLPLEPRRHPGRALQRHRHPGGGRRRQGHARDHLHPRPLPGHQLLGPPLAAARAREPGCRAPAPHAPPPAAENGARPACTGPARRHATMSRLPARAPAAGQRRSQDIGSNLELLRRPKESPDTTRITQRRTDLVTWSAWLRLNLDRSTSARDQTRTAWRRASTDRNLFLLVLGLSEALYLTRAAGARDRSARPRAIDRGST